MKKRIIEKQGVFKEYHIEYYTIKDLNEFIFMLCIPFFGWFVFILTWIYDWRFPFKKQWVSQDYFYHLKEAKYYLKHGKKEYKPNIICEVEE